MIRFKIQNQFRDFNGVADIFIDIISDKLEKLQTLNDIESVKH